MRGVREGFQLVCGPPTLAVSSALVPQTLSCSFCVEGGLPRKSLVRLTDLPDTTITVDRGHKASKQQLIVNKIAVDQPSPVVLPWFLRHLVVRFAWWEACPG